MGATRRRSQEIEKINAKTRRLLAHALSMLREALNEERIPSDEAQAVLASIRQRLGIESQSAHGRAPLELDAWLEKLRRGSIDGPESASGTTR
jgi:hypothetical protein